VEELLYTDDFGELQGKELLKTLRSKLIGRARPVPKADGLSLTSTWITVPARLLRTGLADCPAGLAAA